MFLHKLSHVLKRKQKAFWNVHSQGFTLQALLPVEYGKYGSVRVFWRFLLPLGYAISGSRMSCFLFFPPTTRARRPALQKDWMEKDGKDATEKRGMIKRAASARRRCSVPTRQKFIRIYTSRNSSSHAADGRTRKATFSATCPAEQKNVLTANCGSFHSNKRGRACSS